MDAGSGRGNFRHHYMLYIYIVMSDPKPDKKPAKIAANEDRGENE
jgi:hypothetical protein